MSKPSHIIQIQIKRKRQETLRKLREKYLKVKGAKEKEKIIEKMKKITPWLSEEEFLLPTKQP